MWAALAGAVFGLWLHAAGTQSALAVEPPPAQLPLNGGARPSPAAKGVEKGADKASAQETLIRQFQEDRPFTIISQATFDQLGPDLPDGGATVKALADAAPMGAFDPRKLESLPAEKLGYRAQWHELRYKVYGLDWDITGLALTPNRPLPGLPTLVLIHGGSANLYEFYVDLFSNPGLGQYLAQQVRVLLVTIPGNYKHGGWMDQPFDKRIPAYVLDKKISEKEAKVRNASYTFRVVVEGVRQLIEKSTSGPVVVVGHSTAGEIPHLLLDTPVKERMAGLYLGWGSGGPARLSAAVFGKQNQEKKNESRFSMAPNVAQLRARTPDGPLGYTDRGYIGPLNPCKGSTDGEVARCWFRQEERRRPQFKQVLQDIEHQGATELRADIEKEIRTALAGNSFGVKADEVINDLFMTMRASLTGWKKMIWLAGPLDEHWNYEDPEKAQDLKVANEYRKQNPETTIRVASFEAPMTHYGHIERPKQLAGALIAALTWLTQP
jgi:hypothetical protein